MTQRTDYPHFQPITTRWHDNDAYGHVNNVTYYSFFDTAVNTYLIEVGGLDIHCLLYTSPSPRDRQKSRMPSSA